MSRGRRAPALDLVLAGVIALVVLGPVLWHRGFVLRGDMVFAPDQPWKDAWLGLDGRVPRFVPGDALVAAATSVLPGEVVQRTVLLLIFVVAGVGVGRLVAPLHPVARAAAITLFLWNPWVYERLAIGQWGVVVGYAFLPWTVLAAERVRDGRPGGWPALVAWLGAAAFFSPAGGLVALAVVLGVLAVPPRAARLAGAAAAGLAVNLPWILPSLLRTTLDAAPGQFEAFAARGESPLGVLASVLSLGGIWKSSIVPEERTSVVLVALSLAVTVVAVLGLRLAARTQPARVTGLGAVALLALALSWLASRDAVASGLDHLAAAMPAVGMLRDSPRYLGPVALALAVGLAASVDWLWRQARPGRESLRAVAVAIAVVPALALPSLAWGLGGFWQPVGYPAEWYGVRDAMPSGRTVVLPWEGAYRGFAWNGRRAGLDPAPRFFPGDVLIDDRVLVGDRVLASEDPGLRAVGRALRSPDVVGSLRRLGVRNLLVEKGTGSVPQGLSGQRVLHDGRELVLYDLGPAPAHALGGLSTARRASVVLVDALVLVGWLVAVGAAVAFRERDSEGSPCMVRPRRAGRGRTGRTWKRS